MGSLEEEKLFQMVHDFIESESPPPPPPIKSPPLNDRHANYSMLKEILASNNTDGVESEVVEIVLKHMRNKMEEKKNISLKKWIAMRLKRDGYTSSLCQTSWPTTLGCPAGEYEYIEIMIEEGNGLSMRRRRKRRLIVDIDFKSQFELARPTSTYKHLTSTLPTVFVGDEQKLKRVLSLLCPAAKQSLRERGLHIPPWRTISYMQSKWLSNCHNVPLLGEVVIGNYREVAPKVGATIGCPNIGTWAPPLVVEPKRRDFGGGSGLSRQFSNMSAKCC